MGGKKTKKKGGGGGKNKHKKGAGGGGMESKKNSAAAARKKTSDFPVSGLMNLGNTCFFNSVMQSIGQTEYLRQRLSVLLDGPQQQRLTLKADKQQLEVVMSEQPGKLTTTLHTFMRDIATPTGRPLNPRPLFSQICDKAPRFRGYQQQDSQELLRYLLDSLKNEEVHRMKQGILAVFKVNSGKKSAQSHLSQKDKDAIKMYGNAALSKPTYIDEVFGGVLVSTITCTECQHHSTIHEHYLDLSLPVPRDKAVRGEGRHWSKSNKREKSQKDSEIDVMGVRGGEEVMETSNGAAMSKHQMKKAKKKTRKGKGKQSLQDLPAMLSKAEVKKESVSDRTTATETDGREEEKEEGEEEEQEEEGEEEEEGERGEAEGELEGGDIDQKVGDEEENQMTSEKRSEKSETAGADIETKTLPMAAEEGREEEQNDDCSNPETTPPPPTVCGANETRESNAVPGDDEETVEPARAEEDLPAESTAVMKTEADASPRQPETTPPSNEGDASPRQPDETTPLSNENHTSPQQPEETTPPSNEPTTENDKQNETTPTLNGISTVKQFEEDTLEGCLSKFCSIENLSGVNRFCCSFCTQQRAKEKAAERTRNTARRSRTNGENLDVNLEQGGEESRGKDLEGEGEARRLSADSEQLPSEGAGGSVMVSAELKKKGCQTETERRHLVAGSDSHSPTSVDGSVTTSPEPRKEDIRTETECGHSPVADPETHRPATAGEPLCNGGPSVPGAMDHRESSRTSSLCGSAKESNYEGDSTLDTSTERAEEKSKKSKEKKEEPVFRDATKQLLIRSLPPVLTLHMKRFLQDGRRLRKNGCHIDFPNLLDMAPFCDHNCKAPRDDQGQTLYSLYAVVEHAGGMQGGHYTAYVRVRNSHAHPSTVGGANDHRVTETNQERGVASPTSSTATVGACTANNTTDDQRSATSTTKIQNSTTPDHLTTERNHTTPEQDHNEVHCHDTTSDQIPTTEATSNQTETTADQTGTTADQTETTADQTGTTADQTEITADQTATTDGQTATTNSTKTQPNHHTNQKNHKFDLSSIDGQWYHISDTHIRTATDTEVHKSQAYLLFYEQLPFKSS